MNVEQIRNEALVLCREEIERRKKFSARCERMGVKRFRILSAADFVNQPFVVKPWERKHRAFAERVAPHLTYEQWDGIAYACGDLAHRLGYMDGISWLEGAFEALRLGDGRLIAA